MTKTIKEIDELISRRLLQRDLLVVPHLTDLAVDADCVVSIHNNPKHSEEQTFEYGIEFAELHRDKEVYRVDVLEQAHYFVGPLDEVLKRIKTAIGEKDDPGKSD